ncbi:conjugal transfer protein TraF [Elusimicrobiota bacterium]
MRNIKKIVLALSLIAFVPIISFAEAFKTLGARPLGIGGAFVAIAEDAIGAHYNPAGLYKQKGFDIQVPAGARVEFTKGLLKNANTLSDIATKYDRIQAQQNSGGSLNAEDIGNLMKGLSNINDMNTPGKGLYINAQGGLNMRFGRYALSVNNFTAVAGDPNIDLVNIGLGDNVGLGVSGVDYAGADGTQGSMTTGAQTAAADSIAASIGTAGFTAIDNLMDNTLTVAASFTTPAEFANAIVNYAITNGVSDEQITASAATIAKEAPAAIPVISAASTGNPYSKNTTNIELQGASFTEVAFGFGRSFFLPGLSVGANLKLVNGNIGYFQQQVLEKDTEAGDSVSDFKNNAKSSLMPAVDVGFLWNLRKKYRAKFGIVGKNLNAPKFKRPQAALDAGIKGKYKLDGQIRAGAALFPLNFWTLAADMDLTENATPLSGFKSRDLSLGTEINVFNRAWLNIPLRAGLTKNLAESDSEWTYCGGFGLNFLHVTVELSGALSSEQEVVDVDGESEDKIPANASAFLTVALNF